MLYFLFFTSHDAAPAAWRRRAVRPQLWTLVQLRWIHNELCYYISLFSLFLVSLNFREKAWVGWRVAIATLDRLRLFRRTCVLTRAHFWSRHTEKKTSLSTVMYRFSALCPSPPKGALNWFVPIKAHRRLTDWSEGIYSGKFKLWYNRNMLHIISIS